LLEGWQNEEKRHHQHLKKLYSKPFIAVDINDFSSVFRGDQELEERYLRSKRIQEKLDK
jgi:hypothetical protein